MFLIDVIDVSFIISAPAFDDVVNDVVANVGVDIAVLLLLLLDIKF